MALLRETQAVGPGVRALWLEAPAVAAAWPGHFVMVEGGPGRTTRRPFSVSGVDRERGLVRLLIREVGPASRWLSGLAAGHELGLHGPLGRGFAFPPGGETAWVVGGGIGVAPLLFLTAELRRAGYPVWAAVGGRTAGEVWSAAELAELGAEVAVATEDGSAGERGLVTGLLETHLSQGQRRPGTVYACGPRGMLETVARRALAAGLRCQVSVEERMACGVGACAGCSWPEGRLALDLALRPLGAAPRVGGEGVPGGPLRVCRDGPCFEVVSA
ncbi:MAG TPA: dihydroorotate dehydrogenase electron transfer subunit [Firmicutes bacterium]|nr:dihydroorotate dehydrogenase electron transfer subunit [Bacillota bacterium]